MLLAVLLSSCSIKTRIKRADKKYEIGEYYDAAVIYKQVYPRINAKKERALKAHVAFNQGECYRILNNTRAAGCYAQAIRFKYPDSIAYFRQAQVLSYQGKYKDAEKAYEAYLASYPSDAAALAGLKACREVGEWKKQMSRYKVGPSKEFNQKRSSNFAPAFIGTDGDALMFTSNRQENSSKKKLKRPSPVTGAQTFRIYSARRNAAGAWEDIQLPEGLYDDGEESEKSDNDSTSQANAGTAEIGVCSFTADGKTMYFTFSRPANGQDLGAKIFTSTRASGQWTAPQEVVLFRDSSITVGHPAVSANGDTLIFVSDAPGGFGGKDLWMAEQDGAEWGNVQNLGPLVNTSEDELFPCYRADGRLYFASNGHAGYGGLDLFVAERDTLAAQSDSLTGPIAFAVRNMGQPFNSNGDDFGITFVGSSENGFFSSNRGQRKGLDQIYSFYLPEMVFTLQGAVTDQNGAPIADAMLRIVGDDGTNSRLNVRRDGTYKVKLNRDVRYAVLAAARAHLNQTARLNTLGLQDSRAYTQDFTLAPVSKPVQMDNVFYEYGKWNLTPESETGLQTLVKLLNDNPNITIELSAHTDMRGDSVFNVTLSQKRAQAVVDYLVEHGIERERLTPVGYGKQRPVIADKALHDRYQFIPVEQVLDEPFILALPEDKQEICNQINRRTEFKVLKTTYKLY